MQTAPTQNDPTQSNVSAPPEPPSLHTIHRLELEHGLYARRLDTLRDKLYLTEAEKMEEVRLKKLKLHLKDEMERLRRMGFSPTH
jgi:uncharacterized protein YdcH (DUF465 family)